MCLVCLSDEIGIGFSISRATGPGSRSPDLDTLAGRRLAERRGSERDSFTSIGSPLAT